MSYGNNAIYCRSISSIPKVDHFAIITENMHYTPGDQRSIDYLGHGYPASSDAYVEYKAFLSKEDWEAEINEMSTKQFNKKEFKAIVVKVPTVEIVTRVVIK